MAFERSVSSRENFGKSNLPIPTWNQNIYPKTWKDLNKIKQNVSLLFNQTCLNEILLPNYTYFKIHDPAAHHDFDTQNYHKVLYKDNLKTIKKR